MTTNLSEGGALSVSMLQEMAWAACNASYHESNPDAYRTLGRRLYQEDVRERIEVLFARSDEQNARLEAYLSSQS